MRDGFYPNESFNNKNVPKNGKVLGSLVVLKGEIVETYYELNEKIYCVGIWPGAIPWEVSKNRIKELKKHSVRP